ncbi:MAG: histidine triad family protein [Clostridiales bacterium]|jgi:histidine triad (HIT) family protein|nr:histidine triad nucleotide-binding protein [Oscillospiraceae bacterium]MDN5378741.1 histidine triad family protein [Clostridiales bacterium]
MDCIFCKIVSGEIPSSKVYEDEKVLAFKDINPMAPVHILVIPKEHISGASEINESNSAVVAHIFEVAAKLAKDMKLENGFRIVTNCGPDAGQTVNHLHFHLIGGKKLNLQLG